MVHRQQICDEPFQRVALARKVDEVVEEKAQS